MGNSAVASFFPNNRITLLKNGETYFPAIESAIDDAVHEILLLQGKVEYRLMHFRKQLERANHRTAPGKLAVLWFNTIYDRNDGVCVRETNRRAMINAKTPVPGKTLLSPRIL